MRFEWDPTKARANLAKHNVSFELACRVWDDPLHVIVPDRIVEGEQRWHAIGVVGSATLLVVVHTIRGAKRQMSRESSGRGRRLRTNVGAMKPKPLSQAEKRQLARLAALPEEAIDTADIPEAPAANWRLARRGALFRPVKQPVTIRLDSDIVAWFKSRRGGRGYQTEINDVLRRYVTGGGR